MFDDNYVNLSLNNFYSITVDLNQINIYFLLKSLTQYPFYCKILTLKQIYFCNIIKSYDPLFAIGHNINRYTYLCKKLLPNIITIVYQHSYIYDYEIDDFRKGFDGCKSDYFLVFDERHKKIFSKFIISKYLIAGSVRNNEKILKNRTKKYSVMFISQFRNFPENHFHSLSQKFILETILEYCEKNNHKLSVALNSGRSEKLTKLKSKEELAFFNHEKYKFNVEFIDSYELANKSELCVCISSNLGIELLSRNFKVLHLPIFELYDKNLRNPYFANNQSPLFYRGKNKKVIHEKIEFLLNIDSDSWESIVKKSGIKIKFDEGNKILKNILIENQRLLQNYNIQ